MNQNSISLLRLLQKLQTALDFQLNVGETAQAKMLQSCFFGSSGEKGVRAGAAEDPALPGNPPGSKSQQSVSRLLP